VPAAVLVEKAGKLPPASASGSRSFTGQNGRLAGLVVRAAEQILPAPRMEGGTIRKNPTGNRLP
jgi:hypothetical protein